MTQRRVVLFGAAAVALTMAACGSNRSAETLASVAPVQSTTATSTRSPSSGTVVATTVRPVDESTSSIAAATSTTGWTGPTITWPATTLPTTLVPTPVVAATTPPSSVNGDDALGVSYLVPPPLYEPQVFADVGVESWPPWIGLGDGFSVVGDVQAAYQGDPAVFVVEHPGGAATRLSVEELPTGLLAGPGRVIYGEVLEPARGDAASGPKVFAVAVAGDLAGQVIDEHASRGDAAEPFDDLFGHGPDGVIDRWHDDVLVSSYVDIEGHPFVPGDRDWPTAQITDERTVTTTTGSDWQLAIERDPAAPAHLESRAAAGADQTAIYMTWIGPRVGDDPDYSPPTIPVIAALLPDGTGTWYRLPEGWQVADSNKWGTLLTRTTEDVTQLAFFNPTT